MLVEHAEFTAAEGAGDRIETAMAEQGIALLRGIAGVRSVRFGRGVENPDKFLLLVEWDEMAAHTAFTHMPEFGVFRQLLAGLTAGGAMEHFVMA